MTGTGSRAHIADSCAACTVITSATRISPHPTATGDNAHSDTAAAAAATVSAVAAAAVNTAMARCPTVMLMTDHAATPAAASNTCAAPKSPGTASANAAAIGGSAATDRAVANRGAPVLLNNVPSTATTATALTANTP